jgi:hypothetical protein
MRGIARPPRSVPARHAQQVASDRHGTSAPRTLATPCSTRERWCGSECTGCSGAIFGQAGGGQRQPFFAQAEQQHGAAGVPSASGSARLFVLHQRVAVQQRGRAACTSQLRQ